ncbi:Gfo/Idh/MocA family protein [Paenibacillus sp. YN15]|uniref:Gfo/Idh/MocA family protein n=1 Tax=Paenibacillus sp. YN15 TaxID=1742774 RepID=UPI000DCCA4E5|nr:Gfo/Idh/MocA family oxidoreductase [Paenibacillus sp. YN15]RAU93707.1 hypothetical protein DQG13_25295 [Paenibacillus sp. YN15]
MNGKRLRIALIGCGGMAKKIRRRYLSIPGAELALLVDTDEAEAASASEELGGVPYTSRFGDALAEELDMLDISTPNHLHMPQAVAALQAGKHVLIQKPLTPSVEEAERIVAVAAQSGKQAGMYMSFFDNPLYHEAKMIVDGGWIGRVVSVRCRGAGITGRSLKPENWRASAEKTGGGAFIQLALHPVNMVQWLIGDTIESVAAFCHNRFSPHVGGDDASAAICRFAGGALGTLEASYCSPQFSLAVFGTEGYIIITESNRVEAQLRAPFQGAFIRCLQAETVYDAVFPQFTPSSVQLDHNPYNQHAAFVSAVLEGRTPPVPVEHGLRDLRIVQAVYRSAREQTFVKVE